MSAFAPHLHKPGMTVALFFDPTCDVGGTPAGGNNQVRPGSSEYGRLRSLQTKARCAKHSQQHVVKMNNYLVDMKYLPIFRQVRDSYLADENRPASTTIAISGLAREGALLEVEAVAVLPKSAAKGAAGNARKSRSATKVSRRKGR